MRHNPRRLRLLSFIFAALLGLALGTGTALADEPSDEKAEEGDKSDDSGDDESSEDAATPSGDFGSLSGTWESDWGPVKLTVDGSKVSGSWKGGTFKGTIDENGVINYDWEQPDGPGGKGTFNVLKDGRLVGRWGYGVSANNGGDWTLWRGDAKKGDKKKESDE